MIYLEFISPTKCTIPIKNRAVIYRKDLFVIVDSEMGSYNVGVDLTVSRRLSDRDGHLEILVEGSDIYIKDLGSTNGTMIRGGVIRGWQEGRPSETVEVSPGEPILLGFSTLFRIATEPTSEANKVILDSLAILNAVWAMLEAAYSALIEGNMEKSKIKFHSISEGIFYETVRKTDIELSDTIEEIKNYYDILSNPSRIDPILIDELKNELKKVKEKIRILIQTNIVR